MRWRPSLPFVMQRHVSVVRLAGMIGASGQRALSDRTIAPVLEKAFRGRVRAVALIINSPGGSPAQSSLIAARIRRLADEKAVPVFAFVEDVAASGGYWLATAADEIWVDERSIVGSIGVVSAGFGADILLARAGLERRVYSAGTAKVFNDPFQARKPEDEARMKRLLDALHKQFIGHIKERRGTRLRDDADIFNGEFWLGQAALDLGLVDGIGHLEPVMKERFGDKTTFNRVGPRWGGILSGLFGRDTRMITSAADEIFTHLEERAAFARFGL